MRRIDLTGLKKNTLEGLNRVCEDAQVKPLGRTINDEALAFFVLALKNTQDNLNYFPHGKWTTIQQLRDLMPVEAEDTVDRGKVADAIELIEQTEGSIALEIARWSKGGKWRYEVISYDGEKDVTPILKLVKRIERKKPYESSDNINGYCTFRDIPIRLCGIAKCEVVYEDYEEEVPEMVATGKMIKVPKKRAVHKCQEGELVADDEPETGRKVRP